MNLQVRRRYELLLETEPASGAHLRSEVEACLARLEAAFSTDAVFNLELARAIGQGCLALLERYDERPHEQRQAITAAVTYFVDADDDDGDLDSVLGFDDDAEVFNHVVTSVGRYDLVVSLA